MQKLLSINFLIPRSIETINFCGVHDSNLRCLERITKIKITPNHDGSLTLTGDTSSVLNTKKIMEQMLALGSMSHHDITVLSHKILTQKEHISKGIIQQGLQVAKNKFVKPYTISQEEYIHKILTYDITFGIGSAGTGKSYIAIAAALRELRLGSITKIILTRPIVETGENLGFLPGTLEEKIDPYIRPLYDALYDMISPQEFDQFIQNKQLELAPLAYMRGRTLTNAFIILDEAQNATLNQMKMFLTRLGQNSKMVITGDLSQIDLQHQQSGLVDALKKLHNIDGIGLHQFEAEDSVRHGLVKKIINAYNQ
ncbi:MAG: PhoH family protein [Brevinema sp.]